MADEVSTIEEENPQPLKKPELSSDDVRRWLSRARTANRVHRKELMKRYRVSKERYNSSISPLSNFRHKDFHHGDVNFLFKIIRDFIASIFFRNPQVNYTSRDQSEEAIRNIENLEQKVNDDVKDNREFKGTVRQALVDESLAGIACTWLDYDYRDQDLIGEDGNPVLIEGLDEAKRDVLSDKVVFNRFRPENLIRPLWLDLHKWKSSPYLGYVDIVSLEDLKADMSLDGVDADGVRIVEKLKGSTYKELREVDDEDDTTKNDDSMGKDDLRHAKVYYIFIRGANQGPLKRLVITDEKDFADVPLSYGDWDKGHGEEGKGYPIHILALNDAAEGFIPPSEAWILEPLLQIIDYVLQKMNRHMRKSSTRTFYREGEGGIKKAHMDKIARNVDQELIGLTGLPPGVNVGNLVTQIVDQSLSGDHIEMVQMARNFMNELSRQPSFAQQQTINQDKTATETQAIQLNDTTENGDYIDKFKDYLIDVLWDWGRLTQKNFQGTTTVTITDKRGQARDVRQDVTRDEMQGDISNVDIDVDSFLPPNKELKRRTINETLQNMVVFKPLLDEQGKMLNAEKMTNELMQNIEMRDSEDLIIPKPLRDIDQQVMDLVFKGIPFNPQELGGDLEKAKNRLLEIFSDDVLMAEFEEKQPGSQQLIIEYLQFLDSQSGKGSQGVTPKAPTQTAETDVGANAALLGAENAG